jgi:hypothetical protein
MHRIIPGAFAVIALSSVASAHPGRLNSEGCHAGKEPYHCHRSTGGAPSSSGGAGADRDCGDFTSWREAQDFFERSGPGDPHGLDADADGIACESLR